MAPIPVRYKSGFGIFLLIAGSFILLTGLMLGTPMQLGLGVMHVLIAIGFLSQPWFVVHADRIEVKNLLGMTLKTHSFGALKELELVGEKLHSKSGAFKPVGGWLARGSDLERVQAALGAR